MSNNLDSVSAVEMKIRLVQIVRELIWVTYGEVHMSQADKDALAFRANELITKFQSDFIVN